MSDHPTELWRGATTLAHFNPASFPGQSLLFGSPAPWVSVPPGTEVVVLRADDPRLAPDPMAWAKEVPDEEPLLWPEDEED